MSGSDQETVRMQTLSIVVPVYNEQETVPHMVARLTAVLQALPYEWEVVFVNDGSRDATRDILGSEHRRDPRIKSVTFARNFGQQIALLAGLRHAAGDAVIMMDGDLQHPPELIPDLVKQWEAGHMVVETVREANSERTSLSRAGASAYYWLINRISGTRMVLDATNFTLMDRRVVNVINALPERHVFVRGLVSWVGFPRTTLTFQADNRQFGETKYSFFRLAGYAMDGLFAFSSVPLRLAFWLGLCAFALATGYAGYALLHWVVHRQVVLTGWTSLIMTVLIFGGMQLLTLGIIGEYLGRVYDEVKGRPLFIVQESCGIGPQS